MRKAIGFLGFLLFCVLAMGADSFTIAESLVLTIASAVCFALALVPARIKR